AQELRLAQRSPLMLLMPPAWFMGLERVLLGHRDPYFVQLTQIAVVAFVLVTIVAGASYFVLYRRFDRVMLHALSVRRRDSPHRSMSRAPHRGSVSVPGGRRRWAALFGVGRTAVWGSPARDAVRDFAAATLRRSTLHQGVLIGL